MWDEKKRSFVELADALEANRQEKNGKSVFRVGEEFELHGLKMRLRKITKKDIVLRPV